MRHLLLALMIVLLPLRGWMGDAMATDMAMRVATGVGTGMATGVATGTTFTTKTIAADAGKTSVNSPFEYGISAQAHPDCGGHSVGDAALSAGADTAHTAHDAQDDHCKPCQACQACHTVALFPPAAGSFSFFSLHNQPDAAVLPFANADVALSKRPPIS